MSASDISRCQLVTRGRLVMHQGVGFYNMQVSASERLNKEIKSSKKIVIEVFTI